MAELKQMAQTAEGRKVFRLAQSGERRGLTQKGAILRANKMGACILSNKEFDRRLVLSDTWKSEDEVYPAWTGTLVAFKEKDAKLGDVVKYTGSGTTYIFEVPKEYQNEKNAILVINHGFLADGSALILPNEKGREITYDITDKSQIALLQNFPSSNGWYNAGNTFGIPLGAEIPQSKTNARCLYRVQNYVGLLTRGDDFNGNHDHCEVFACDQPSDRFGVLVSMENAEAKMPQTKAQKNR